MGLQKTLTGRGKAPVNYHMIPAGKLSKNLLDNTYAVEFDLISFVDQDVRDNEPGAGYLDHRVYTKTITEEQMAHIIDYLGLYPHAMANEAVNKKGEGLVLSDAEAVL